MDATQLGQWLQNSALSELLGNLVLGALFILLALGAYYLIHIGNSKVPEPRQLKFDTGQFKLIFFMVLGTLVVLWIFARRALILSLLTPFFISGVLAYALNPVVAYLVRRKLSRLQAVAALFVTLIVLLVVLSMTLLPSLGSEIRHLGEQLPQYSLQWYKQAESWYNQHLAAYAFLPDNLDQVTDFFGLDFQTVSNWLLQSLGSLMKGVSSLVSSLVTLVTVPVLTFYFMKDGDKIAGSVKRSVPPGSRQWMLPLARQIDDVLGGFIRGQLIVALFVGILSGMALLLLGIDFALILGIVAGITNIIPYLGPFIGAVPAVLMALLTSPLQTLWVILAFTVIQQVESSVISPRIVGKRVGLHPTLVILALLTGGALWGLVGLLIAVPAAAVVRVLILAIIGWFRERYPSFFEQ
ncbi:AI-2E family transporter [Anoxynatronum buryatiense]|uniref:Predicted PurR-regulated permease PerM n=1 Tax=Anoxynatronum buryatiense TaxID=489973 RepID=A0AA46AKA1_9CLOT|nr:AI-2E family transporter [Anoxynatronum buryatiense]SMP67899.1 Predicted PurR-regulated permease PerM [Anoxynatronum buryatiense]